VTNNFVTRVLLSLELRILLFGNFVSPAIFSQLSFNDIALQPILNSLHLNVNMAVNNQKAVLEEPPTESPAQGDQCSHHQSSHDQGPANGSIQVPTDFLSQQYESSEFYSSAAAEMDFWSPETGAAGVNNMCSDPINWWLDAPPTFASFQSAIPCNNLSNELYAPYSSYAASRNNYESLFFNNKAIFNNHVPIQNVLVNMPALELYPQNSDPRLQTLTQPSPPTPEAFHSVIDTERPPLSPLQLTNRSVAEMQTIAVETRPSPAARPKKQRRSERPAKSKSPIKKTKGKGHIEGFDRKTGQKTLVGRYPALEDKHNGDRVWICPDVRCMHEDGRQLKWTTKNGYKYHLQEACLQNPESVRSIYLAKNGFDKYLLKNAKKSDFLETCACNRQFKSQGGWHLHRNVNETTKNGRCLERLRNRGELPDQLQQDEVIPDDGHLLINEIGYARNTQCISTP
jgi:hypothetical protein